jgi:hypothetical protein
MPDLKDIPLPIYPPESRFEIEAGIVDVHFGCDLHICKGACCTMKGAIGAPILAHEIAQLDHAYSVVAKYLPERAIEVIDKKGVWQKESDGSLTIPTIDHADCVFVTYEGDIALCAIEKAYRAGEIEDFPKPISCALFPIRIYPEKRQNTWFICYEEIPECKGGRVRGKREDILLLDFLEMPMVRALGESRLQQLRKLLMN